MYVFTMRFDGPSAVQRAFGVIAEDSAVAGCTVELEDLQIRVLATAENGIPLVERIHDRGGLVWCTRNPLVGSAPGD